MEQDTVAALKTLTGELEGQYYPLAKMDKATQNQMIQDHFLFRDDDELVAVSLSQRDSIYKLFTKRDFQISKLKASSDDKIHVT